MRTALTRSTLVLVLHAIAAVTLLGSATAHAGMTFTYTHTDIQGNVVAKTNQSGSVIERRYYEPYGLPKAESGSLTNGETGFTGHVHDTDSGLVYMQQRYYDPVVGQLISIDPVGVNTGNGHNFNRYWYGNDNPYTFVDPDGRAGRSREEVRRRSAGVRKVIQIADRSSTPGPTRKIAFGNSGSSDNSTYDQTVTVTDENDNVVGEFNGSSKPNPFDPSDRSRSGDAAYPTVAAGEYEVEHGLHKGKPALIVNDDKPVPTTAPNPNNPNGKASADFIRIHSGSSNTWKGSAGCLTIAPDQWVQFRATLPIDAEMTVSVPDFE